MNLSDIFKGTHELTKSGRETCITIEVNCLGIRMKKDYDDYQIVFVKSIDEDEKFIYIDHILPSDISPISDMVLECSSGGYILLPNHRYRINVQTTVIARDSVLAIAVYRRGKDLPDRINMNELYRVLINGPSNGFDRV